MDKDFQEFVDWLRESDELTEARMELVHKVTDECRDNPLGPVAAAAAMGEEFAVFYLGAYHKWLRG